MGAVASNLSGGDDEEPVNHPVYRVHMRGGAVEVETPRAGDVELGQMGPDGVRLRRDWVEMDGRDRFRFRPARLLELRNLMMRSRFCRFNSIMILALTLSVIIIWISILRFLEHFPMGDLIRRILY